MKNVLKGSLGNLDMAFPVTVRDEKGKDLRYPDALPGVCHRSAITSFKMAKMKHAPGFAK